MTSLLVTLCLAAPAPAETIRPYYSGYVYWWYLHGYMFYSKSTPGIDYADGNDRGFVVFNLTGVPDTLTVESAAVEFYQHSVNSAPQTYLLRSGIDVFQSDPEGIYLWLTYGSRLTNPRSHPGVGWVRHEFTPAGVRATDSCLGRSYFNVAVLPEDGSGSAHGYDAGDLAPRLILTFVQAGLAGRPAPALTRARLAPNPAGKWVTLGDVPDLVLYGRDGREVRRLEHGRNDLSGLESGVYFAPGCGKLVVRR